MKKIIMILVICILVLLVGFGTYKVTNNFFQAEGGIRDIGVTGVQTCALPIWN